MTGCAVEPVRWDDSARGTTPREPARRVGGLIYPSAPACANSVRTATSGSAVFTAWWEIRSDSSAELVVARSEAGARRWKVRVVADTADRGARGCGRPPPDIAADSASGYLHLAYFLEPSRGGGVFYAHSMDGGHSFHQSVPIVFGRNPARVSIASSGDRVVIAYEDPNSSHPEINLALSRTMGHIFEQRADASGNNVRAKQPVVSLAGDTVRVWWSVYSPNPTISATRPGYRQGIWE